MFFQTNEPSLANLNKQLGRDGVRTPATAFFGQPPTKEVGKVLNSAKGINWVNNPAAVAKQMEGYMTPSTSAAKIFNGKGEVDLAALFDAHERPSLIADGNRIFDLGTGDEIEELMNFLEKAPSFNPNTSVIRNIPNQVVTGAASPLYTKGKVKNILTASDLTAFDDDDVERLIEHLVKTAASRGLNCITFAIDLEEMAFYNVSSVLTPGTERQIIELLKNAKI